LKQKNKPGRKPKIQSVEVVPKQIKLLRVSQVALRLNVSTSTIYLWCDHGHLEKVKLTNGTVRVTEKSVDEMIKRGFIRGSEE
jgi:excisionase family DNA binding protein